MNDRQAVLLGAAAAVVVVAACLIWWWNASEPLPDGSGRVAEPSALTARIDSLQGVIRRQDSLLAAGPGLTEWDRRRLREIGLAAPARQLADSLLGRSDLIPYEGVVGGTMAFRRPEITILSNRWVLAGFDDGHVAGKMLLEYSVSDSGSVTWDVIDVYRE